jgi:diguanylate cyclase (GGDEF)-like protein
MGYSIDKKIFIINILILSFVLLIICSLLYLNVHNQKQSALTLAQNKTESLANFIISDIDRILYGVEEIIEGIYNSDDHIISSKKHAFEMKNLLEKRLRPYMYNILIVNKEGEIIHWTKEDKKPDIKDREYVTYHQQNPNVKKIFIGQPLISRINPKVQFFAISKAFYKKDVLDKIVVITLDLDFFYQRYKESIFNQDSSIFMASPQGLLYTRYPMATNYIGKRFERIIKFGQNNINRQHFDLRSPIDQKVRIATLVRSDNYPIIAGVTVSKEEILTSWEKDKNNTLFITFLIGLAFFLILMYYIRLQNRLINLSQVDSLTQLFNRGHFTKQAQKEFERARRFDMQLSIIMLDIDNFKYINDTYGHQKGDEVIRKLAKDITKNVRGIDLCARYGGEEFIILLIQTPSQGAQNVSKRIKDTFEYKNVNMDFSTTASFGIASLRKEDTRLENIIQRADKALYISKRSGKNCIHII